MNDLVEFLKIVFVCLAGLIVVWLVASSMPKKSPVGDFHAGSVQHIC